MSTPPVFADELAAPLCASLGKAVDGVEGGGAAFLVSYRPGPNERELPPPLRQSAFVYDNALAVIALTSCGDLTRARRIGEALLRAEKADRTFHDGRIRNAYRAGPVGDGPPALPGWWDQEKRLWAEDAYQDGTATGNVAWAALALLTLGDATHEAEFRLAAGRLLDWITTHVSNDGGTPGYSGGFDGFDPEQTRLTWSSTEHNIDVHAVATWLRREGGVEAAERARRSTREFLDLAFASGPGFFRLGTKPDGSWQGTRHVALDTQLWPLLGVEDPPSSWQKALDFAERDLAVPGGFDFNEDRDGLWVEGTAQAALTLRAVGRGDAAVPLLRTLAGQISPSGYLFASREASLTTGITIGPSSVGPDFLYFRRPHLGATAWAVLAASGWNPFTGRRVE